MVDIIFFWFPLFLLFHSYVVFPVMLHLLARRKDDSEIIYNQNDLLPFVSVILSVYNEEQIIEQRIRNIYASNYPIEKFEVLVGSDGSNDRTNIILQQLQNEFSSLRTFLFNQRKGKGNVLNSIVGDANGEILILTDAKVQFSPQAVFQLIKHFRNAEIGIVGANIINRFTRKDGISVQEKRFMSREIAIKHNEGKLWGIVMGAYGACYAIRSELFITIPLNFAVDDFFITLNAMENGAKGIIELNAICYEEVPNLMAEEFRRKVRISSGNYQNLKAFIHLLLKFNPLSFCFFSHKVIRWIGPFLLLVSFISNIMILSHSNFYLYTLVIQLVLLVVPLFDFFLHKIHIHIITLRFVTHFYSMNLALLIGFIKYLKGVKTDVWEPTKREH
jgi:cellulose synthase/poly-beta-1,6-N-acetylglucosamine synthase-like glycosyltransferase